MSCPHRFHCCSHEKYREDHFCAPIVQRRPFLAVAKVIIKWGRVIVECRIQNEIVELNIGEIINKL